MPRWVPGLNPVRSRTRSSSDRTIVGVRWRRAAFVEKSPGKHLATVPNQSQPKPAAAPCDDLDIGPRVRCPGVEDLPDHIGFGPKSEPEFDQDGHRLVAHILPGSDKQGVNPDSRDLRQAPVSDL